jgi:hypothetical protein
MVASEIMDKVSNLLWVANKDEPNRWHDYWANSTSITGIRSLRVRCTQSEAANAVMQQVLDLLAPYEGQYKIYPWQNSWDRKYTCIMLYYRSWQAGEPRKPQTIYECEPGYELTVPTGSRVSFKGFNDIVQTGTISRRYTYNQMHPYYVIALDEPYSFSYQHTYDANKDAFVQEKYYRRIAYNVQEKDIVQVL